jgi:hypothetical protein
MKTKYVNLANFLFFFPTSGDWKPPKSFFQKRFALKENSVVSISFLWSSVFFAPIVLIFFLAIDHNQENLTKFGRIPDMEVKHFKHHFIYLDYNYGDFFLEIWQIMTFLTNIPYTCWNHIFQVENWSPKKIKNWPAVFVFFQFCFVGCIRAIFFTKILWMCRTHISQVTQKK